MFRWLFEYCYDYCMLLLSGFEGVQHEHLELGVVLLYEILCCCC